MSVYIRILLRYAVGALVVKGLLSADLGDALAGDPNVIAFLEVAAGAAIGIAVERYYVLAKGMGWAT